MLGKFKLLFNTVKFLKPIQIFYQLFYRIKKPKLLAFYEADFSAKIDVRRLLFRFEYYQEHSVTKNKEFTFLNIKHCFENEIEWDFQDYGKLWNYNLQYFNFLHQQDIDDAYKLRLVLDINNSLHSGELLLEPYPVSLRIMNLIRYFSTDSLKLDDKLLKALYGQTKFLSTRLEYHLLGNHLLENAFALMMGGYFFRVKEWCEMSKKILLEQLDEQILNDGGHFELSPMYHQIILFRLLELIEWYSNSKDVDGSFLNYLTGKASLMLSWLRNMTFVCGDIPHFNDSAPHIALKSYDLFNYADELKIEAQANELTESGYRRFSNQSYECIVDVGPVGPSYQPGHAHADALSFILYFNSRPLMVEVGTSTYQVGDTRSYERSTAAHNTVVIGGKSQSEVWGGFRVGRRAKVQIDEKSNNQIIAHHDGYREKFGVDHFRSFNFSDTGIEIRDKIGGTSGSFHLHFHPEVQVSLEEDTIIMNNVGIITFRNALSIHKESYKFADGYNKYSDATEIIVIFENVLDTTIQF